MPRPIAPLVLVVLAPLAARGEGALPDPCYDPDRPWPVYCERYGEDRIAVGDAAVRFQLYAFYEDLAGDDRPPQWVFDLEPPYRTSAIRVHDEAGATLLRLEFNVGTAWIEPPVMIDRAPDPPLLVVTAAYAGSGALREDHVFRFDRGPWSPIAASPWPVDGYAGWGDAVEDRLPAGHAIRKGVVIDFDALAATSAVWRDGDANCCPTGGEATIRFAIAADALVVVDVEHRPDAP
jgi:hypothetical protein